MDTPMTPGWYLIVRKDAEDQSAQVRAEWDGAQFLVGADERVQPSDVAVWKPILDD